MKWIVIISLAGAAVACGGASESHNSSQSGASAHAGVANASNQSPVTLTGCLRNADTPDTAAPRATGSSGTAPAGPAVDQQAAGRGSPGERFTLTGIAADKANGDTAAASASYVLDGNMEALRAHVNQQVRVTGALDTGYANNAGPKRVRVQTVERTASACVPQ
jgi:hypothetical protein